MPMPMPMPMPMRPVRTAARALIIEDGRLLAVQMRDQRGEFFILPGGGQNSGETLTETLQRECLEEIGARIEVGPMAYVREYIGRNHGFSKSHHAFHQVESVFHCKLLEAVNLEVASERDRKQVGLEWLPLAQMKDIPFYPEVLKAHIHDDAVRVDPLYLGDVN